MLQFLLHTDAGLLIRIILGVVIFAALAVVDLRREGRNATRWREYAVLLIAVLIALLYGAINDQITVTISPEYFIYGKGLDKIIGEHPPESLLRFEAARVGLKATWSVGLICGVALLLANNPFRNLPRLKNRQLLIYLAMVPAIACICGMIGGWLGHRGHLIRLDSDFASLVDARLYRPYRFMAAWGVHLGGYLGGAGGTCIAVWRVVAARVSKERGR